MSPPPARYNPPPTEAPSPVLPTTLSLACAHKLKEQRVSAVDGDPPVAKAHSRILQPGLLVVDDVGQLVAGAANLQQCAKGGVRYPPSRQALAGPGWPSLAAQQGGLGTALWSCHAELPRGATRAHSSTAQRSLGAAGSFRWTQAPPSTQPTRSHAR